MGIFGWDYPPGCHSVPGDEDDPPCEVCGNDVDNCICPECPVCGDFGNPKCYTDHGLVMTQEQTDNLKRNQEKWERDNAYYPDYDIEDPYLDCSKSPIDVHIDDKEE